jgi:ribosome-associated protein
LTPLELVTAAAKAAADKKARDVMVLDVHDLLGITDYFLICSGMSDRQVRTIAEEIEKRLKEYGSRPLRREGERQGRWVLLDFEDFVVHVFGEEDREYYGLERLWKDAPRVEVSGLERAAG